MFPYWHMCWFGGYKRDAMIEETRKLTLCWVPVVSIVVWVLEMPLTECVVVGVYQELSKYLHFLLAD